MTKQQRQRAADYLATIHATGWLPSGMHHGTAWSLEVLLGYTYDLELRRFVVKPEALALTEGHPLLATIEALQAQGFRVNTSRIANYRRWTLSKGVPMIHREDLRSAYVSLDGRAQQYDDAEGRWRPADLGNPGREVRA
jgi:hypothetical protein